MTTSTDTQHTTYQLSKLAQCMDPDATDGIGYDYPVEPRDGSPGAQFLRRVEDDVREAIEDERADEDTPHEIADGAVPVYTYEKWQTFTDLGAWQEDPTELGATADDLNKAADIALYMIAQRLAAVLLEEYREESDNSE